MQHAGWTWPPLPAWMTTFLRPAAASVGALAAVASMLAATPAAAQLDLPLVKVQLRWTHQAQFAGYYVAKQLGYYEREGIDVEFAPGGSYVDPMTVLSLGGADVAIGWLASAIGARLTGADVVNIAQVFKRSAMRLVCRRAAGINHPNDIKGKTIGVWDVGDQYNVVNWLRRQGRSVADVRLVHQRPAAVDFLDHTVDCATAMSYNEYVTIIDAGVAPSELLIVSFDTRSDSLLEDGLYARNTVLQDATKRDHLASFLRASARGWRYASRNRDEAITITKLYAPLADAARQRVMLDSILQLIDLDSRFGQLDLSEYERDIESIGIDSRNLAAVEKAANDGWTHRIWYAAKLESAKWNLLTIAVQHDLRKILGSTWFYVLILAGTATFGLSGFMQALKLRYDLWGAFILTYLPALGGGTLRDLLIGGERRPLYVFTDPTFVYVVIAIVLFGAAATRTLPPEAMQSRAFTATKTLVDTIGLATLTVFGANVALAAGLTWYWVPICAAISCAGGGILLSMVTVQQPRTFQGELYEEIAVGGGLFMLGGLWIANHFEHTTWIVFASIVATFVAVFLARLAAIRFNLRSYRLGAG
jgi:NitT/TauT family transport system substrate-binding protein